MLCLAAAAVLATGALWSGRSLSTGPFAFVTLASLLMLRPALLGEVVGPVGAIPMVALILFVLPPGQANLLRAPVYLVLPLIAALLLPTVLAFGGRGAAVGTGLVITPIVAGFGYAFGHRADLAQRLAGLVALLAGQQALGLVLTDRLNLAEWDYAATGDRIEWTFHISAVGSITTGSGGVFQIFDERLTGPFGEPGVFAAFLVIAAMIDVAVTRRIRWPVHLPIIAAVLLTQSIAGIGTYLAALAVHVIAASGFRFRRFSLRHTIVSAAGFWIALSALHNTSVLDAKRANNEVSLGARLAGTQPSDLLNAWLSAPFGTERESDLIGGINLLQTSITFGPLLLLVGLWLYLAPLRGPNAARVVPAVTALVATITVAQPPFLYAWVFFAFVAAGISHQAPRTPTNRPEGSVSRPDTNKATSRR